MSEKTYLWQIFRVHVVKLLNQQMDCLADLENKY